MAAKNMSGNNALIEDDVSNIDRRILKIETTFKRLETVTHQLKPLVESLLDARKEIPEYSDDINHVKTGYERFTKLLGEEAKKYQKSKNLNDITDAEIQTTRHDLRAQVGAVLGYSELIMEELIDEANEKGLKYNQLLNLITQKSKSIIPIIDSLRIEDQEENGSYLDAAPGKDVNYTLHEDEEVYDQRYENMTVLIIDDSAFNREILSRRLSKYGVNVLTAENGAVGLDTVSNTPVDLILLDIMMPIMNGYEALKHLKENKKTKDIPVLMISALSEVDSIVRCIEAGAEDYLPTPFNPIILNARIKACLEKKLLRNREQANILKIEQVRQRLATSIESMEDGFAVFSPDGELIMSNKKFQELYPAVKYLGNTGFTYEELLRKNYELGVYFTERRRASHHAEEAEDIEDWIKLHISRHKSLEPYLIQLHNGRWIEVTSNMTPDNGMVSVHKDVTDRKKDEERLTYLALNDPLTGLANRSAFETRLDQEFQINIKKEIPHNFAVMYMDLDGFKSVNDKLGHEAGDMLLKQVAQSLKESIRTKDIAARLGGDEFAVLLLEETDKEELSEIANRILENVGTTFSFKDITVNYGISIGISVYPDGSKNPEEFLNHADTAMYQAKKSGKGKYLFYSSS